jgi:thioredoxin-related protein
MKHILYILFAVCLLSNTASAQGKASIEIGTSFPATNTEYKSTDGKSLNLAKQFTDKGLLVMFSCNTCPYVIKSQARTIQMMQQASKMGIGMVIVNSNAAYRNDDDSYDAMVTYAKKQKYNVPYVMDNGSELADIFGASRTPEVFLFDASKKLVYKGAMEDNPSSPKESTKLYLQDAMNNMVAEKSIQPNSTKSIGCSIKRL